MPDQRMVWLEIEQRAKELEAAFESGNMAALAGIYAAEAQLLSPGGAAVQGRQAISQYWRSVRASGIEAIRLTTDEIEVRGEVAYERGTVTLVARAGDGLASSVQVRYLVEWKRRTPGSASDADATEAPQDEV